MLGRTDKLIESPRGADRFAASLQVFAASPEITDAFSEILRGVALKAMRTNPEHEIVTFVPGVGITAYVYAHHGTVSEVNVRLVERRVT